MKREGRAKKEYPEVKKISIWLDSQLWKLESLTKVGIHNGWIPVDIVPHGKFYIYIKSGWKPDSEMRVKLLSGERRLIIFCFQKGS